MTVSATSNLPSGLQTLVERFADAEWGLAAAYDQGWAGPDDADLSVDAERLLVEAVLSVRQSAWDAWLAAEVKCGCRTMLARAAVAASAGRGCGFLAAAAVDPEMEWDDGHDVGTPPTISRTLATVETGGLLSAASPAHALPVERTLLRMGLSCCAQETAHGRPLEMTENAYGYGPLAVQSWTVFTAPADMASDWVLPGPSGFSPRLDLSALGSAVGKMETAAGRSAAFGG